MTEVDYVRAGSKRAEHLVNQIKWHNGPFQWKTGRGLYERNWMVDPTKIRREGDELRLALEPLR